MQCDIDTTTRQGKTVNFESKGHSFDAANISDRNISFYKIAQFFIIEQTRGLNQ